MSRQIKMEEITIKLERNVLFRLKFFSEQLSIPLNLVIQNIIIKDWARNCAQFETGQRINPSKAPEFTFRDLGNGKKKLITGHELFYHLEELYKEEYAKKSS